MKFSFSSDDYKSLLKILDTYLALTEEGVLSENDEEASLAQILFDVLNKRA